jgi:hypothetical protein
MANECETQLVKEVHELNNTIGASGTTIAFMLLLVAVLQMCSS